MSWLRKLFGGTGKPRILLDQVQEAPEKLIVGGYRRLAASHGCAPTSKTSDEKIIEIYRKVRTAFHQVADQRGERIPAKVMNFIVLKFLQAYEIRVYDEIRGDDVVESHLAHELQNYSQQGLGTDYCKVDLPGVQDSEDRSETSDNFTAEEADAIWKYTKAKHLDGDQPFQGGQLVNSVATDLGLTPSLVIEVLGSKSEAIREASIKLCIAKSQEDAIRAATHAWMEKCKKRGPDQES